MRKINWKPEGDGNDTSLVAFYDSPWSFEETIARFLTVAGEDQVNFDDDPGDGKVSFEVHGELDGNWFSLCDYKEDDCIHIGGNFDKQFAAELSTALTNELLAAEPTPFCARTYYGEDRKYGWPNDVCFECGQKLPGRKE